MISESKLWYVYVNEQTYGPIDSKTLMQWYKKKRLENGFVHDGADWRKPTEIDILQPSKPLFQDIRQYTKSSRDTDINNKNSNTLRTIVLSILIVFVISGAVYYYINNFNLKKSDDIIFSSDEQNDIFTFDQTKTAGSSKQKNIIGTISFLGAASQVCGASFLVDYKTHRLLIDAGLFYSNPNTGRAVKQDEILPLHTDIDFPPRNIDSVFITHAHIDHIGRLPYFYLMGMQANLYMTGPTKEILISMLKDSFRYSDMVYDNLFIDKTNERVFHSRLLECDIARQIPPQNFERLSRGRSSLTQYENKYLCPNCAEIEIKEITDRIITVEYFKPIKIDEKITVYFYPAAHILGSAWIYIEYKYHPDQPPHILASSGDMGEINSPTYPLTILNDKSADVILVESTYGVGYADATEEKKDKIDMNVFKPFLEEIQSSIETGKIIMIPAFVLDRAHRLLLILQWGLQNNIIDKNIPIYITSSTTEELIPVYRKYFNQSNNENYYKKEFIDIFKKQNIIPFVSENIKIGAEKNYPQPSVIIAHSAMMDQGEALRIGQEFIEDENLHIIFVGYASPWSVAGRIKNAKNNTVNIYDKEYNIKAKISNYHVFSGHAQGQTLGTWVKSLNPKSNVFVIHGDRRPSLELADYLKNTFNIKSDIIVPKHKEIYNLYIN